MAIAIELITSSGEVETVEVAEGETFGSLVDRIRTKLGSPNCLLILNVLPLDDLGHDDLKDVVVTEFLDLLLGEAANVQPIIYAFLETASGDRKKPKLINQAFFLVTKNDQTTEENATVDAGASKPMKMVRMEPMLLGVEKELRLTSPKFGFLPCNTAKDATSAQLLEVNSKLIKENPDIEEWAVKLSVKADDSYEVEISQPSDDDEDEEENDSKPLTPERLTPVVKQLTLSDIEGGLPEDEKERRKKKFAKYGKAAKGVAAAVTTVTVVTSALFKILRELGIL